MTAARQQGALSHPFQLLPSVNPASFLLAEPDLVTFPVFRMDRAEKPPMGREGLGRREE